MGGEGSPAEIFPRMSRVRSFAQAGIACIGLAALAALAGCGPGGDGASSSDGIHTVLKHEAACDLAGLTRPKRQTVIVVDEASIRRSDAAGFRTANPGVLEAILAVSDPVQAVESGALEPRERVTLLLAPKDGTQPRAMFTGCAPALSAEDKAKAEAGSSSAQRAKDSFFATGAANRIADQAEEFRTTLLGAVQHIAEGAPEQQGRAAPSFEASSAVRSLKTAARVADPSLGAPRLVLIAPAALRAVPAAADPASARQAGFAAARATRVDLGQSEVAVALADGRSRDFVEAFLLGSRGRLISWSSGPPSNLAPAPVAVRSFA